MYNKHNIQARNLLGLVYFETGEVVAALSEWVISKNLQPSRNLASEYINKLQANSNKLEAINETIRKYNDALNLCREGHEDMAAIRLKKILTQNPKLIKGYHLLALVQIKEGEYNKARRTLRKAAKIDKTNTTTLRFLSEIDEQTGVSTRLDRQNKRSKKQVDSSESDMVIRTPQYKEKSRVSLFFTLIAGFAAGLLAFYLLAVPAIRQGIYREANQQIVKYSDAVSSQGAELTKAQSQAQESGDTVEAASKQIEEEKKKSSSYEALIEAYAALQQQNMDEAALKIQNVYADLLSADLKGIYNTICNSTGTTGIEGTTDGTSADGTDSTDVNDNGDSADTSGNSSSDVTDEGSYDTSSYDSGNYDDTSYDDSSYDSGSYDDGSDDGSYDSENYDESSYDDAGY
jgi:tetratricopeptide (TPR) repeat protein